MIERMNERKRNFLFVVVSYDVKKYTGGPCLTVRLYYYYINVNFVYKVIKIYYEEIVIITCIISKLST